MLYVSFDVVRRRHYNGVSFPSIPIQVFPCLELSDEIDPSMIGSIQT